MAPTRSKTVNLIYGSTGVTKTSRLGDAAEYYYAKTGLPSRLICTDNAGWGPIESLVDAGIIIPFKVTFLRPYLVQDLSRLSQGWWPVDPQDPLSKLEPPKDLESKIAALLYDGWTTTCQMMMEVHQKAVTPGINKKTGEMGIVPTTVRVPLSLIHI